MKGYVSICLILTLFFSCKSGDYLIEQGGGDIVFERSFNKINSSSDLSVRDVQNFEEAYEKVLINDHKQLSKLLKQSDSFNKWESLFSVTKNIQKRQRRLKAISPIQDKSKTYTAQLTNSSINDEVIKSIEALTSVYLKEALFFIKESRKAESRTSAKYAYEYLEKLELINPNLSVLSIYKNEALELGRKTVQIAFDEPSISQIGEDNIANILGQVELEESVWTHFVYQPDDAKAVDQMIQISIKGISIGQDQYIEESRVTRFSSNKVTLGGITTKTQVTPVFSNEVRKLKQANLKGSITLFDLGSNEVVSTKELDILFEFNNSSFAQNQSRSISNINNSQTRYRPLNILASVAAHRTPSTVKSPIARITPYDRTKIFPEYSDIVDVFSKDIVDQLESFVRKSVRS